jgi:putative SOS response-associated peptidase YedK
MQAEVNFIGGPDQLVRQPRSAAGAERPLTAFAGIWTEFKGDRGTKSKPIPDPHLVYGFLTAEPNAIVEPIHPKAMPVILTTDEERDVWLHAPLRPKYCSDRCRPERRQDGQRQHRYG